MSARIPERASRDHRYGPKDVQKFFKVMTCRRSANIKSPSTEMCRRLWWVSWSLLFPNRLSSEWTFSFLSWAEMVSAMVASHTYRLTGYLPERTRLFDSPVLVVVPNCMNTRYTVLCHESPLQTQPNGENDKGFDSMDDSVGNGSSHSVTSASCS